MSEPGDKIFAIMPSNLFDCTIVKRNGNGTVVLSDDNLGGEYNAEAICVYKVISRVPPPTPSLGPESQASTELSELVVEHDFVQHGQHIQILNHKSEVEKSKRRRAK